MLRTGGVVLLASAMLLAPAAAIAANETAPSGAGVAIDASVLADAKVERNGKHVGTVQRVMVNPTTGRIDHVHILMTEGQKRTISVPWSAVRVYQDNGGNMMLTLTDRAAAEVSPSATVKAPADTPVAMDVRRAQQELRDRGYYFGPIDGVLGPSTESALYGFQRDHRLAKTGRLDPPTIRILGSETAPAAFRNTAAMDVYAAQRQLKARGYYAGAIDGALGPNTQAALRGYQRDHGLRMTGRLDSPTVRSLSSETS